MNCAQKLGRGTAAKSYIHNGEAGKVVEVLESDTLCTVILPSSQGDTNEPGAQPIEGWIRCGLVVDPIRDEHAVDVKYKKQRPKLHLHNLLGIFVKFPGDLVVTTTRMKNKCWMKGRKKMFKVQTLAIRKETTYS